MFTRIQNTILQTSALYHWMAQQIKHFAVVSIIVLLLYFNFIDYVNLRFFNVVLSEATEIYGMFFCWSGRAEDPDQCYSIRFQRLKIRLIRINFPSNLTP